LTKELNIIVGGNGGGKTTFYYRYLHKHNLDFLNADELAKEIEQQRRLFLALGKSFCFETVFSHPSKVDFLANAKSNGFTINLFVIHIDDDPTTNVARVNNRQAHGGHYEPEDKIRVRIPRTLSHIAQAIPLCDTVSFYDNKSSQHPFERVAVLRANRTLYAHDTM
jgi:predicted ABC-type ATPase